MYDNKRRKSVPGIYRTLAVLTAFLIIVAAIMFITRKSKGDEQDMQIEAHPNGVTGIESIIENDNTRIAVHYPKLDSDKLNAYVAEIAEQEIAAFKKEIMEESGNNEFYMTFDAWPCGTDYISVRSEVYEYYDGMANGQTTIRTMILDTEQETELQPEDLFAGDGYLEMLSEKGYEYFSVQKEYMDNLEILSEGLRPVKENFSHILIYEDRLEIIFDAYQIAEKAAGNPVLPLLLEDIEAYMDQELLQNIRDGGVNSTEPDTGWHDIEDIRPELDPKDAQLTGEEKLIALTFDDGPHEEHTDRLLGILEQERIKATFFVLGSRAAYYPDLTRRIVAEGHQLGSHTYNHKQLTSLSGTAITEEIGGTTTLLAELTGIEVTTMRPPYGAYDDSVKATADMPLVLWSLDTEDWKYRDADHVFRAVTEQVKDGDIILMHDIHGTTIDAAERIIPELKSQGYTFVTVDRLIELREGEADKNKVYTSVMHSE